VSLDWDRREDEQSAAGLVGIAFVVVLLAAGAIASVSASKASTQHMQDLLRRPPIGSVVAQVLGILAIPCLLASPWRLPGSPVRGAAGTAGLRRRRPAA
jgi:hypothetical protein